MKKLYLMLLVVILCFTLTSTAMAKNMNTNPLKIFYQQKFDLIESSVNSAAYEIDNFNNNDAVTAEETNNKLDNIINELKNIKNDIQSIKIKYAKIIKHNKKAAGITNLMDNYVDLSMRVVSLEQDDLAYNNDLSLENTSSVNENSSENNNDENNNDENNNGENNNQQNNNNIVSEAEFNQVSNNWYNIDSNLENILKGK